MIGIIQTGSCRASPKDCRWQAKVEARMLSIERRFVANVCIVVRVVWKSLPRFSSDPCEFFRVGNDPNRLNLPFRHIDGQDGEYLTASADDQGGLTVDFL
jgi:hypothetical protein